MLNANLILSLALFALSASAFAKDSSLEMKNPAKEHSFGLTAEPIWLLVGGLGAKADFRLSQSVSLGLGGMLIPPRNNVRSSSSSDSSFNYKWSMYEIYLGPTFMLTGDFDSNGIFVTPAVGYLGAKITNFGSSNLSGALNTYQARVTAGYQWVSIKSIRIAVGGGLRALGSSEVIVKEGSKEVLRDKSSSTGGLVIDFQVGMLF
jgi:hypothetical protein